MTQSNSPKKGKRYWRTLGELAGAKPRPSVHDEFTDGATDEIVLDDDMSRRTFLGLMGASAALATGVTSGCIRKPVENILPFNQRPEDYLPGEPRDYATSMWIGGQALGLVVRSMDGRPSKIEGNPMHPSSKGGTSLWAQAEILSLYDPDRLQSPESGGSEATWEAAEEQIANLRGRLESGRGAGAALLVDTRPSPTVRRLLRKLKSDFPQLRIFRHDSLAAEAQFRAVEDCGLSNRTMLPDLTDAKTIVALDSDFMAGEGPSVRLSRAFADGRRLKEPGDDMNRLYSIEPSFSITGMNADHRYQLAGSQVGRFLQALVKKMVADGLSLPGDAQSLSLSGDAVDANETKFIGAIADELRSRPGESVIIVGHRQPAWVHTLALIANTALGNIGRTLKFYTDEFPIEAEPLSAFAGESSWETVIVMGGNPVFDAPHDLDIAALISGAGESAHFTFAKNETSEHTKWSVPAPHALEAWGDLRAEDATLSLAQPLIAPLFDGLSEIEVLARLAGESETSGHEQVRKTWNDWSERPLNFEDKWQTWLHDGVIRTGASLANVRPVFGSALASISGATLPPAPTADALELAFQIDPSIADGRYANNSWLQELPDPISKVTWDNAAVVAPSTARRLGLAMNTATTLGFEQASMVRITHGGRTLEIPAFVMPGVAQDVIVLPIGYGRTAAGRVGDGVGVNVQPLRTTTDPWYASGATIAKMGRETFDLATTQNHTSEEDRGLIRESTFDGWLDNPTYVQEDEIMPLDTLRSSWEEPHPRDGQQWGMSIDLTSCIGCNVCTIACQAENNIMVVGKERVMVGREMAWIRLDRYFSIDWDKPETWETPEVVTQPIACMHCENAPCEQVCPVAATVHGPEGTNDMVYNRCIGTRYCANNCPFKVRRFNFFAYSRENDEQNPLLALQKNPNVTVRFRGVMEKCTYCIQRVQRAKSIAKRDGNGVVPDGAITTACAQACPTNAIVFGDINDPNSEVSRLKAQSRDYALLAHLNIKPRTTYLGKIRNPNPALA